MAARMLRAIVLVAAATGTLALLGEPAMAYIGQQHCEPLNVHRKEPA